MIDKVFFERKSDFDLPLFRIFYITEYKNNRMIINSRSVIENYIALVTLEMRRRGLFG